MARSLPMRRGGRVPGRARVAGDSTENDTVRARLSPGEIVVPRSHAGDPELAKRFVEQEIAKHAALLAHVHIADHPGRFGSFAMVPLTDTDGALREIEYALDTLKADGIGLLTSYGDKWLGDPLFLPVMEELNRRKAVVYTHPYRNDCCRNLVPDVFEPLIELGTPRYKS